MKNGIAGHGFPPPAHAAANPLTASHFNSGPAPQGGAAPLLTEVQPVTVRLFEDKSCKGSVRYATPDEKAPIQNVYLSRTFANPMPTQIDVTITPRV